MRAITTIAVLTILSGCSPAMPDDTESVGAKAWLAQSGGTIPHACIVELIERFEDSNLIDETARQKAQKQAMELAGDSYALALAGERMIVAAEEQVKVAKDGVKKGFVVDGAVDEAEIQLERAISDVRHSRIITVGLDSCKFYEAHEELGIKPRPELRW